MKFLILKDYKGMLKKSRALTQKRKFYLIGNL